jgi:flagellar hook-associated protein 1 FlgK
MSLFSTLNTGVSGLKVADISIATAGHNISNANNDYYTRQRVVSSASVPLHTRPGDIGTGARIDTITRIHDEFIYARLKQSSNMLSNTSYSQKRLEEVAKYFPDLQGAGLQEDIKNYFEAWNNFASNPNDGPQKINLIQRADTLVSNLSNTREKVRTLQNSINDELKTNIDELNRIGEQIAKINGEISRIESGGFERANDLRDQRDKLELTLAELVEFSVFKGQMRSENVIDANLTDLGRDYHLNIAGYSFVDGATFHPVVIDNFKNNSSYYSIYHEQEDGRMIDMTTAIQGGKIGAMLDLRGRIINEHDEGYPQDGILQGYIDDLDAFAKSFIVQTNNIYAKSAKESMVSSGMKHLESDMSLTNYDSSIQRGSFDIIIYDTQGNEVARKTINVDSTTAMDDGTPESIVGQINSNSDDNNDNNSTNDVDDYFFASFGYDLNNKEGRLSLSPTDANRGFTIAIEDSGTNLPGLIGISRFFEGNDAKSASVDYNLLKDPSSLQGFSAPVSGNNSVANEMIQLQYESISFYKSNNVVVTESIESFYRSVTSRVASDAESTAQKNDTNLALFNTVFAEHQSISGVSIDEELVDLMRFQTAYSANSKVITTIDKLLETLLGLK